MSDCILFLDIDGVSGDPVLPQRQVRHPQRAAGAVDRGGNDPLDRQLPGGRLQRDLPGGQPVDAFDQFQAFGHHRTGIVAAHGGTVSVADAPGGCAVEVVIPRG